MTDAARQAPPVPGARAETKRLVWLSLALLGAVAWAFGGVVHNGFVGFDDPGYLTGNPHVTTGLGTDNLAWAFGSVHMGNWHPLTWLSHMLDWELFGGNAAGHHLMNVGLHGATAVLLLLAWRALCGSTWIAALVAGLFALHPLRVESVAWAAERKDVLAGLFFAALLLAWARHARDPSRRSLSGVALLLALGLMAKPMLVTVPALLLLLDIWPLRRLAGRAPTSAPAQDRTAAPHAPTPSRRQADTPTGMPTPKPRATPSSFGRLLAEQLPLLAIVGAAVAITLHAQGAGHAMRSLDTLPLGQRLLNLPLALGCYLSHTFWPVDLSFLYPHPAAIPGYPLARDGSIGWVLVLLLSAALLIAARRGRPWLALGWLWFLGMLVPVNGLVAVGEAGLADRYTYLPGIGLAIMAAHEAARVVRRRPALRPAVVALCLAVLAALGLATHRQVNVWHDSEGLYRHALALNDTNPTVHILLGVELLRAGRLDEARHELEQALAQAPGSAKARYNLGAVALAQDRLDEARSQMERALSLRPDLGAAHNDLAVIALRQGHRALALKHLRQALASDPNDARAAVNLARLQGSKH